MPPQFSSHQNLNLSDEELITYFALTDSRNKRTPFGIKKKDRDRHAYVIGKTGMGKSTLLENMAVQDIQRGEGICFIDPHGSTAEKLMEYIPEERVKDVLYYAPFDMQYPISFNVLEDVDADKRHFVVAGLMSTFEKIWVDAWSARMAYILQNTLAALLEFPGATLLGVNRMYIDKEYRKNVIARITDPAVRSFWVDEYSKYTDRYAQEATPAIQNKIGQFAANALVRNIIGQEQSAFDLRELMDKNKIFIVNLSKGRVGEGNANLLGSMLITKIYLAAMSRADASPAVLRKLPYFYLYVDEFQNFANRSFADILSEARKYKLALTIAHQYVEQMEEEVASAVFGNVGTMMAFRVGAYDAEVLEKEFAPTFMMEDLVNLGARQIYLKLMIDGISSQPFSAVTMPPIPEPEVSHRDRAVAYSRATFSRPRAEVEKDITDWVNKKYEDPEAEEKERARQERRAARDAEGAQTPPPRFNNNQGAPRDRLQTAPPSRTPAPAAQRYSGSPTRGPRDGTGQTPASGPRVYRQPETVERPSERDTSKSFTNAPSSDRPAPPRVPRSQEAPYKEPKPEQTRGDLREILSRLSAKATPPHLPKEKSTADGRLVEKPTPSLPEEPAIPAASSAPQPRPAQNNQPVQKQQPSLRPPVSGREQQPRDDGKGVTTEGRESLKALLSTISASKPQANETHTVPTPKPQSSNTSPQPVKTVEPKVEQVEKKVPPVSSENAAQKAPENVTKVSHIPVTPGTPPSQKAPQQRAPKLSEQELQQMLHVNKPEL